jgi:hypothetical protein
VGVTPCGTQCITCHTRIHSFKELQFIQLPMRQPASQPRTGWMASGYQLLAAQVNSSKITSHTEACIQTPPQTPFDNTG